MIFRQSDVVDLSSELHPLVLLTSDDGTDVRTVDADNAVFHLLFLEQVRFAGDTLF